jgi:hypothetical protein
VRPCTDALPPGAIPTLTTFLLPVPPPCQAGDCVIVNAGSKHQFVNTGETPLILQTGALSSYRQRHARDPLKADQHLYCRSGHPVYAPAEHNPTTVHKTKEESDKHEDDGTDEAPDWSQRAKSENGIKGE